ncbi:uncharacterized protein PAF06_011326 [Gastrophryne carolinensis]
MCEVNQTQVTQIRLLGFQGLYKLKILLFACFLLINLVIVIGNLLIIILVTTFDKLKNPMFFFLKQLATSDIVQTTIILPMALKVIIKDEGSTKAEDISLAACLTQLYFSSICTTLQCFLLAVMSYDRYLAICNPLRYPVLMNSQVCLQFIIWLWILAVSIISSEMIPMCQLDFCGLNKIDHFFCQFDSVLELSSSDVSALLMQDFIFSFGAVFLPFGFILITYIYILVAVLKISSAQAQGKAFSTCISHLTSVGSFYGTMIMIYVVPSNESSAEINKYISLLYIVVPPLLNPFIYSLRNHDLKSALQKMFSNVITSRYNKLTLRVHFHFLSALLYILFLSCCIAGSMCEANQTEVDTFLLLGFQGLSHLKYLLFVLFLLSYLVMFIGNLAIIVVISSNDHLKIPMFIFIKHLAIADIMVTNDILPLMLYVILMDYITIPITACLIQLHSFGICGIVQCFLLAIMSYDRYLAICNPLHYNAIMTPQVCLWLVGTCWLLELCMSSEMILVYQWRYCGSNTINHFFCELDQLILLSTSDTSVLELLDFILSILVVFVPFVFIIVMYNLIAITILKSSSNTGKQKAFSTCSSHLIVVCSYYGTLIALYVAPSDESSLDTNKFKSLLYIVLTPMVNPIIYSLRNHQIKRTLQRRLRNVLMQLWETITTPPLVGIRNPALLAANFRLDIVFLLDSKDFFDGTRDPSLYKIWTHVS